MLSYWEQLHFTRYDYIVVGAGIVGMSTALSLRKRHPEASILILERGIFPSGASTKNAGFACFGSLTELLEDIASMGQEAALQLVKNRWEGLQLLRARIGDEKLGYKHHGGYELLAPQNEHFLKQIDAVNQLLWPIFEKPVFSERSNLIETFGFARDQVKAIISNPFEAQVDTGAMMRSLWTLVQEQNISLITGAQVRDYEIRDKGVDISVAQSAQETLRFRAKRLALCTNAFSKKLLPNHQLEPGRGMVLITNPIAGLRFKGVFHYEKGYHYFRNVGDRVLFGGGRNLVLAEEQTTEFGINSTIYEHLKTQLASVILPGTEFSIDQHWSGIMAFGPDKRPLLGLQSEEVGFAVRLGGMGIALGSLLGDQLAELLHLKL